MKHFITFLIVALAVMVILPSAPYAFNNRLGISFMGGSGEFKEPSMKADTDMGMFGANYTRYFNSLETTDSPYGMREFLQHPSYLTLGIESMAFEMDVQGSNVSMEMTEGTFSVEGMYYLAGGTGIGASLSSLSGEMELKSPMGVYKEDTTEATLTLDVEHYVTDTISAGASLSTTAGEVEDNFGGKEEYDEQTISFGASALINNFFWISGSLGAGTLEVDQGSEFDTSAFELEVGAFPMQKLGIILGVEVEKMEGTDYESTETSTRLSADYSISEKVNIRGSLMKMKEEVTDAGTDEDMELSSLQIAVGVLF